MHAACGGEQGEGEAGDTPDPGRGLRPLHPLTSAFMRVHQTLSGGLRPPALPAGFYILPAGSRIVRSAFGRTLRRLYITSEITAGSGFGITASISLSALIIWSAVSSLTNSSWGNVTLMVARLSP